MKYHVLFAIICAAVAMGVDYERQGHYRGMAFGELEVSSYVEGLCACVFPALAQKLHRVTCN